MPFTWQNWVLVKMYERLSAFNYEEDKFIATTSFRMTTQKSDVLADKRALSCRCVRRAAVSWQRGASYRPICVVRAVATQDVARHHGVVDGKDIHSEQKQVDDHTKGLHAPWWNGLKHISSLSVDYLGFTDCRSSQRASEDFDLYNGQCCLRQHLDKLPSSSSSSNNSVVDVVVAVFVVVVIVDVVVVAVVSSKKKT